MNEFFKMAKEGDLNTKITIFQIISPFYTQIKVLNLFNFIIISGNGFFLFFY